MRQVVLLYAAIVAVTSFNAHAYDGPPWYRVKADSAQIERAKSIVSRDLKDPSSAQFRDMYATSRGMGDDMVCGEVNAKNSYGGYVGFRKFYVAHDGEYRIANPEDSLPFLPSILCDKPEKPLN